MSPAASANHLVNETSPYLRQHAHNPVDWYPWGEEALRRARELDRPIFLSIGYSACHWCHVMEHESFEDQEVAGILNEHFVSIKVDREERPDLDQIYMTAVQLMTGQGGWPMSVFLTPELEPFYGGTYFPPTDRYGRPSFKRLLQAIVNAWQTRRDAVASQAGQLAENIRRTSQLAGEPGDLDDSLLRKAASDLGRRFDRQFGGFGAAPKFPHPMDLRLLLRCWERFGDDGARDMVLLTLDHMARGGMYDHLGGGFHRYSTDERWLVPHFEKMLYDNALLVPAYLEGFQVAGDPFYREIVEQTLAYVLREMTSPEGPFYSSQDADSEGEEGKFFVWSAAEVEQVLGKELAEVFSYAYDVTPEGNWEGHNILHRPKSEEQDARLLGRDVPVLHDLLAQARQKLFEVRERRIKPGRDDKVLTAWNGLMIGAFAQAAQVLSKPDYAVAGARAADFILRRMRSADGRLFRTWSQGSEPKLNAYLEDYAYLLDALVSLYEAQFDARWIADALDLARVMIDQFWDPDVGAFFYTGRDHEALLVRTRDGTDSSTPSGNGMAAMALLRLAALTGRRDLEDKATATLRAFHGLLTSTPAAAAQMLLALDFHLGPAQEFAVVGSFDDREMQQTLALIRAGFRPRTVTAARQPDKPPSPPQELIGLLEGKVAVGKVTTYICRNFACQAPLVGADAVAAALERMKDEG
jgi:uncharacterized protein YyaL (SSP411 family)